MYHTTKDLIVYGKMKEYRVLQRVFESMQEEDLLVRTRRLYEQAAEILRVADRCKLYGNAWQCYIAWLLMHDENPFSLSCERRKPATGTISKFVLHDMQILRQMFFSNFSEADRYTELPVFKLLAGYTPSGSPDGTNCSNIGAYASELAAQLCKTQDAPSFLNVLAAFYETHGVGMLGLNRAFSVVDSPDGVRLNPLTQFDPVEFTDLWGYELQKQKLLKNTDAFVGGKTANNVLLYGDSGTGKSTCMKALLNTYHSRGLRMIELYKHQFRQLNRLIHMLKDRNYYFVIYMDDLSFEDFEIEYKYLKAVIEGGLEPKPKNVLIYATSNRRHLIRETWGDRSDMEKDVHHSDTVQEKLSLADRFGIAINFTKPIQKEYNEIVLYLARKQNVQLDEQSLLDQARVWGLNHGGLSGRVAQQFINHLLGQ